MSDTPDHGVMDASYGHERRESPVLRYRYQSRARVAVDALRERDTGASSHRVLDLGAADGRTLLHMRWLLGGTGEFHGVELSRELLDQATDLPSNTAMFEGDVTALPRHLESGHYDLCTALAVLEHLHDPGACIREAYRVLRPGGVFVATCPNPFWDDVAGRLGLVEEEAHHSEIDGARLIEEAEAAGFEDVSFQPFMWVGTGALPYLRIPLPPRLGLAVDAALRRIRVFDAGFVNQAVVGTKPG